MNPTRALIVATALTVASSAGVAHAGTTTYSFDDSTYSSFADSPFSLRTGTGSFWIEDFEDGILNSLGLTVDAGKVRGPGSSTDSVDGDGGGILDGSGTDGYSYRTIGGQAPELRFSFDEGLLGELPTMAGIVWTDGNAQEMVTLEAFDLNGISLGTSDVLVGDGVHTGSTDADRFLGVTYAGGISAIFISGTSGGLEVDHVQYGFGFDLPIQGPGAVVPVPPAAALGLAGLGIVAIRRRRKQN